MSRGRRVLAGVSLIPLVALGCSREAPSSAPAVHTPVQARSVAKRERLDDVRIELEREECFGRCPSYVVTIEGNGRVTFIGRSHVNEVGTRQTQVSESTVRGLLRAFEDAHFLDLADSYRQRVTDLSTTSITLRLDNQSKRVVHYAMRERFDPQGREVQDWPVHEALFALADTIDAAARTERWITSAYEKKSTNDQAPPARR